MVGELGNRLAVAAGLLLLAGMAVHVVYGPDSSTGKPMDLSYALVTVGAIVAGFAILAHGLEWFKETQDESPSPSLEQ